MREQLKGWLAIALAVLGGFVFFTVFGHMRSGRPLVPALVPVVGVPFGVAFGVLQMGYCWAFGIRKGLVLLPVIWLVAIVLVLLLWGNVFTPDPGAITGAARAITGAACASGLILGISVLNGRLHE